MEIKLKDKTLTVRKWKGKDKREFIRLMQQKNPDENAIMNSLVYGCIENPDPSEIILSTEEFKYVISMIRAHSLGEEIQYNFFCTECQETKERIYNIHDILRPEFNEGSEILIPGNGENPGIHIILGEVRNRDFYLQKIQESEIFDFFLRIQSINDSDSMGLEDLVNYFDDLDIGVLDEVLKQYDALRFKINDINEFVCDCGHTEKYHFDEIPEFFPSDWFNDETMTGSFVNFK